MKGARMLPNCQGGQYSKPTHGHEHLEMLRCWDWFACAFALGGNWLHPVNLILYNCIMDIMCLFVFSKLIQSHVSYSVLFAVTVYYYNNIVLCVLQIYRLNCVWIFWTKHNICMHSASYLSSLIPLQVMKTKVERLKVLTILLILYTQWLLCLMPFFQSVLFIDIVHASGETWSGRPRLKIVMVTRISWLWSSCPWAHVSGYSGQGHASYCTQEMLNTTLPRCLVSVPDQQRAPQSSGRVYVVGNGCQHVAICDARWVVACIRGLCIPCSESLYKLIRSMHCACSTFNSLNILIIQGRY